MSQPAKPDARAAVSDSSAISNGINAGELSPAAVLDRTDVVPSGGHVLTADQGALEHPQVHRKTAPLMSLSEQSLSAIRLVLALAAGGLADGHRMPQWPLLPLLGLASLLLAVTSAPGILAKGGPSSSRTSLLGMVYSLVPAPVQRAVFAAGVAMRTCRFVLEPVAAAIAFAAVLNQLR